MLFQIRNRSNAVENLLFSVSATYLILIFYFNYILLILSVNFFLIVNIFPKFVVVSDFVMI